jgi:CheY-like chemotaxis protein
MLEMDGFQLAELMRGNKRARDIPISSALRMRRMLDDLSDLALARLEV